MREVVYTKMSPSLCKHNRSFFKNRVKKNFVKWCAYEGWFDGVLSKAEIKLAKKKGHLPEDLDVHHMIPLSGAEDPIVNSFANLCVLHKETHKQINKEVFQPQLKGIDKEPYGSQRVITIPIYDPVDRKGILIERKKVLDKSGNICIISSTDRQR
jgi:hypothetical protein